MGDSKRSVSTIAAMDTSSGASMSKKRKTSVAGSSSGSGSCECECELELCSSGAHPRNAHLREGLHDTTVSPASSVSCARPVGSGELISDRLLSSCSSNVKSSLGVAGSTTTMLPPPLDLEAKAFETVESMYSDFKLFSRDRYLLKESCGDSEESMMLTAKSPAAAALSKQLNIPAANMPPKEEIEEFFAMAEKYEQKRFAEKYNYDISKDMPFEGRYEWIRLN